MNLNLHPSKAPSTAPSAKHASAATGLMVRVVLTCATIAVLAFAVDWRSVLAAVVHANPGLLAASVALLLMRIPIMAARWRLILRRLGVSLPLGRLTQTLFLSTAWGLALPSANGNDVIRSLMLWKDGSSPTELVITSVFVDRLIGLLTLLVIALPSAVVFLGAGKDGTAIFVATAGLFIAAAGLLIAAGRLNKASPRDVQVPASPNLRSWLTHLASGTAFALGSRDLLAGTIFFSILSQALAMASAWVAGLAIGLHLPALYYIAAIPLIWLLTSIPITISGIGLREAGLVVVLAPLGVTAIEAASLGATISITAILAAIAGAAVLPLYLNRRTRSK